MNERANQYFGLVTDKTERVPVWRIGRLWELAADLPIQELPLANFASTLDGPPPNAWKEAAPTLREAADLARHINQVDLEYPIILSAEGHVLDGCHRIAKAWMLGHATIRAVRFPVNPEPDKWLDRDRLSLPAEGKVNAFVADPPPEKA